MARPRSQIVNPDATPYYHCVSRCVRRAWLCGEDSVSGRSFEHRRSWLQERIHHLSQIFAIDICAYALMSNHYHLVVRIDRARVSSWSDAEVVRRYSRLHKFAAGRYATSVGVERQRLVQTWRERLGSLSWMMSALNEWIARKANKEDERPGRFWEGRFYSQPLLGMTGLLACMAYVDLNPWRAGVAETLEESDFTSIQRRLVAMARERRAKDAKSRTTPRGVKRQSIAADFGLVPLQNGKASRKGDPIGISLADYIALLVWTQERRRGQESSRLPSIIERLGVSDSRWLPLTMEPGLVKRGALGCVDDVRSYAAATGRQWVRGIGAARLLAVPG